MIVNTSKLGVVVIRDEHEKFIHVATRGRTGGCAWHASSEKGGGEERKEMLPKNGQHFSLPKAVSGRLQSGFRADERMNEQMNMSG